MKKVIRKLKSNRGFSLSELLIALIIVSIMTVALTVGVSSSLRVYQEAVRHAEERTLLSTLSEAIINELRNDAVIVDESGIIQEYISQNFGTFNEIQLVEGEVFAGAKTGDPKRLIGSGSYSNHTLIVKELSITYNKTAGSYTVSIALEPGKKGGASETREFSVKPRSETYVTFKQKAS